MTTTVAVKHRHHRDVPAPGPGAFTHRQIMTILGALMLGILLAALDQTIVATAIRTIADDLHGLDLQAWATTAYLITATISTPLYGKLSDLYGRKPFFLTAIAVFIVGSMLCTISTSMYELAAFRAIQGLGAGGLLSLALAIVGDIVPPRERARYQGYFLAVFGAASVIGPLVGGGFAGARSILGIAGWRWVFLVNVPIAAIALFVVARVLTIPHTRREHRIDWSGAVALAVAVVPMLLVTEQGQDWGWGSVRSIVCYVIAAVGLAWFVAAERKIGDEALLPLRLFRNGVFSVTSVAGLIIGMGMFGGLVLIPLYLQIVKGVSPTGAGLLLLPLMGGIAISSVISGQLTSRTGRYKIFPVLGAALMASAFIFLYFRLDVDTSLVEIDIYMGLFGLGLGGCLQTLVIAAQNAVSPRDMGVATSSATFARQMGGTLGVAVFLSILFSTVGDKIANAFRVIVPTPEFQSALTDPTVRNNPANSGVLQMIRSGGMGGSGSNSAGVLQDSSFLQHIDPRLARPFLVGFSDSMGVVFLIAAGLMLLAAVILLFMEEIPLRHQSGIEALAAEMTAEAGAAAQSRMTGGGEIVPAVPVAVPQQAGLDRRGPLIYGMVTGEGHVPVAGASLTLTDLDGYQLDRNYADAGGNYRLGPAGGGSYLVVCAAAAYQPAIAQVLVADVPVRHDVSLSGAGATLSGTAYIAGSGQPVVGAVVTLIDTHGEVAGTATTGLDGGFSFRTLARGLYTLAVTAPAVHPAACSVEVPVHGDITQDVEVVARLQLVGTVRTASGGVPVPEVLTTLVDTDGHVLGSAVTGTDGEFVFDGLQAGAYTVIATGYPPVATEVRIGSEQPTKTVITLRPPTVADGVAGNGTRAPGMPREGGRHGQSWQ